MCEFFSFLSDGKGSYIYADAKTRKDNPGENHDSHTWLAQHFFGEGASKLEDLYNKYEYNPFTRELKLDNRGQKCGNDLDSAERWCNDLNFKRILPELIIKNIKNPLAGRPKKATKKDIDNLKKWISICKSVGDSVGDSVWKSIGYSVENRVRDSVENSVWKSVVYSVENNVWNRVWKSVWNSVRYSVWNIVRNYVASFFDLKYDLDIAPGIELWNRGFIPSFDGTTWKLHSGKDAKVVYEMKA